MRTRTLRLLIPAALSAGLAGCGLPSAIADPSPIPRNSDLYLVGPIDVVVRDTPDGESSAAFAARIIPAMPIGVGTDIRYVPADAPGSTAIVFDFAGGGPYTTACAGPFAAAAPKPAAAAPAPGRGPVVLSGALCRAGGAVSTAHGHYDGPADPADPGFRNLVHQVVIAMLIRHEEMNEGSRFRIVP